MGCKYAVAADLTGVGRRAAPLAPMKTPPGAVAPDGLSFMSPARAKAGQGCYFNPYRAAIPLRASPSDKAV